jgi:FkbM family methyltransferase
VWLLDCVFLERVAVLRFVDDRGSRSRCLYSTRVVARCQRRRSVFIGNVVRWVRVLQPVELAPPTSRKNFEQLLCDQRVADRAAVDSRLLRIDKSEGAFRIFPVLRLEDATHQSVMLANGRPFVTHLSEFDQIISQAIVQSRYWEAAESLTLASVVKPGMVAIDAGANIGWHTILLAECVGSEGRVYAFEPEPRNFLVLSANAWLCGRWQPDTIHVAPTALGPIAGSLRLHLYPGNLGYHSTVVVEGWSKGTIDVPSLPLDHIRFGAEGMQPVFDRPVNLIKADIQGGELGLMQGARRILVGDRPILCLELEPSVTGVERALDLLGELNTLGYRRLRLFTANESNPAAMLSELSTWLPVVAVQARIRGEQIGSYGTLWAEHGV